MRAELSELVNFRGVFSDPFGSEVGEWGYGKVTVVTPAVGAGTGMGRGRRRERWSFRLIVTGLLESSRLWLDRSGVGSLWHGRRPHCEFEPVNGEAERAWGVSESRLQPYRPPARRTPDFDMALLVGDDRAHQHV